MIQQRKDEVTDYDPPIDRTQELMGYEKPNRLKDIIEWLRTIVFALLFAIIIMFFFTPTIVKEHSMEPNFSENDYVILSKKAYEFFGDPKRGDVIVFKSHIPLENGEKNHNKLLIKRVIGVPGDTIDINNGKVFVNGTELKEDYISVDYTLGNVVDKKVGKNQYFCLGDNRPVSLDSRSGTVGMVSRDSIVGKAVFRLLPVKKMGLIKNPF